MGYSAWSRKELLMATGVSIPLRGLEGIPALPGASQDEAVRTKMLLLKENDF